MGSDVPINFFELCRLCLINAGAVNIFSTKNLSEDIFSCTSVKVSVKEKLPSKICSKCLETVYCAKNLKDLAFKNNLHLHSLFDEEQDEVELNESNEVNKNKLRNTQKKIKRRFVFEEDNNDQGEIIKMQINKKRQSCEQKEKRSVLNRPKISVRKDIFDSSTRVTSSTNPNDDSVVPDTNSLKESKRLLEDTDLECPVCKKKFTSRKKLYIHQRNHSKNLYCPLDACGKKFATKGDVQRHIRTHTGERPYKCEVCDKGFTQRGTLKAHREALHGGETSIISK